jgi:Carboxypeptidase regulatory-like domain
MSPGGLPVVGTVLDRTGRPAAGATVMWLNGPVPLPDVALLTQADGSFVMSAPVPGPYTLACRRDPDGVARADVNVGPQGARVNIRLG